jgi:hypothetical protein
MLAAVTATLLSTAIVASSARAQSTGAPARAPLPKTNPRPDSVVGPKVPETFEGVFAARDARAKDALDYLRCMQATVGALQSGALGQVPRGWSITCVQQDSEWRGVFGELTDGAPGMLVHLQYAMRAGPSGGNGMLVRDPIDTTRVNGTARALLRGLAAPLPRGGQTEFVPIALAQTGFTEVWFLPVPGNPTRVVVGGDSLIQMSSDGMRELGHSRSTPPLRQFAIAPTSPTYTLNSTEDRVPLLSELVIARMALGMVPEVHVRTNQYDSILTRSASAWKHVKR